MPDFYEKEIQEDNVKSKARSYDEKVFEESLSKLSGKWNMLTQEESDLISNIAKRF